MGKIKIPKIETIISTTPPHLPKTSQILNTYLEKVKYVLDGTKLREKRVSEFIPYLLKDCF